MERIFTLAAPYVGSVSALFVPLFVYEADWRDAGISAGIAAISFVYWMATYTKKDLTP